MPQTFADLELDYWNCRVENARLLKALKEIQQAAKVVTNSGRNGQTIFWIKARATQALTPDKDLPKRRSTTVSSAATRKAWRTRKLMAAAREKT